MYLGFADVIGRRAHNPNIWWAGILSAMLASIVCYANHRRLRYAVFQTLDGAAENYRKVLGGSVQ